MPTVRPIYRLIAHGEREYANTELFVELDIKTHALKEVARRILEVVEHVV
jgi:hypothetical protein